MRILGIETSCDETAAAIVEDGTKILSNVVASSAEMHAKTGGIIPEQAARQQVRSIIPVIDATLGKYEERDIDAIAVTEGPGLVGSLLVGLEAARTLSYLWNKPVIPVNHLVAHLYANWLETEKGKLPKFPALGLVASGGHTDLVLIKDHGKITWIGGTRDDAAGEAFDKSARLLGLPYPGGPSVAKEADEFLKKNKNKVLNKFPRPLSGEENFDWSFSGLKTAVAREVKTKKLSENQKKELAAEIQEAITDCLVEKSLRAYEKIKPKCFLVAGGVAANERLKEKLAARLVPSGSCLHIPVARLCTDNAAIIASSAYYNFRPEDWEKLSPKPELTITPTELI